jgi:drug/metabolite transporter (DMT)-like permease
MKGGVVVVTALASRIFLRKRLFSHHWTGITLVVVGMGMTGISALQEPSDDSNSSPVLGITLILASLIAQGA